MDIFLLPYPVKEKGNRPFFPVVLLMVDAFKGWVLSTLVLPPEPDLHSLYESLPQRVVDELLKLGHLPAEIRVRSGLLLDLLQVMLEEAGCPVVLEEELPGMDEAIASMISHMP